MNSRGNATFYSIIGKIADLTILGLLWMLTSVLVISSGASSTALYYAAVKSVRFSEGKLVQGYFHSLTRNLISGCLGTLIYLLLGSVLIIIYKTQQETVTLILISISTVIIFSSALYYFPILSRFTLNAYQCFLVSLFMIFRHFPQTLLLLTVFGLCCLVVALLPFLLPVMAGCYAYYSSFLLEKLFLEYMSEDEQDQDHWFMQLDR